MTSARSRRRTAVLIALATALAACGGRETAAGAPTATPAAPGGGQAQAAPEALEIGREYRHEFPAEGTPPARFTFQVPAGSVVQVSGTADAGNRATVSLSTAPPAGLNLRVDLDPAETDSTRRWITSDEGAARWVLEIAGIGGDAVTFMVDAPLQADGAGEGDAGGHAGTAVAVPLGEEFSGLLGDEDREDWYIVPLAGGDVVSASVDVPPDEIGSVSVSVVHNGRQLRSMNANAGGTASLTQVFAEDQVGVAQLQVVGSGAYQLTVDAGPQRDGGTDGDAGGSLGAAKPVDFGRLEGIIGGEDAEDFYVLKLPLDAVVTVEATIAADFQGSARIELNHNGRNVISHAVPAGATESRVHSTVNAADENVYLRVAAGAGSYIVTISATTQPDGDGTGDAPNERAQAKPVEPVGSFEGVIGSDDGRDWYRFEAVGSGPLLMELAVDPTAARQIRMLVHEGTRRIGDVTVGPGGTGTVTIEVSAGAVVEFELATAGHAPYTVTFR